MSSFPESGCVRCRSHWQSWSDQPEYLGQSMEYQCLLYRCAACGAYWEEPNGAYPGRSLPSKRGSGCRGRASPPTAVSIGRGPPSWPLSSSCCSTVGPPPPRSGRRGHPGRGRRDRVRGVRRPGPGPVRGAPTRRGEPHPAHHVGPGGPASPGPSGGRINPARVVAAVGPGRRPARGSELGAGRRGGGELSARHRCAAVPAPRRPAAGRGAQGRPARRAVPAPPGPAGPFRP